MGGRSLEVYAGVLDAEGKPTPVPRVWSLQMFCAWASAGFSAQRWGRDASNPVLHLNRWTLRCTSLGVVPLPSFVSLGSAVVPGQNAAVTSGGGGLGGGVVGVSGPTMFGTSGVASPGGVLSSAEGSGGVASAGSKSVSRRRMVTGGQVPSGSRHLRQLMAREESSGLRASESPASNGQELSETFGPPRKHKIHRWNCTKAQRRLGARSCSVAGRVRFGLLAWNTRGLGASFSGTCPGTTEVAGLASPEDRPTETPGGCA